LGMNAGTENPHGAISTTPIVRKSLLPSLRDYGRKKRLGRFDDVRKSYRPLSFLDRAKFARDWFAHRDTFQKLRADRFFH
jgi:hypothetical protein